MPHSWLFNPLLHVFLNLQVPYHRATTPRHCRCGCFSLSRLTYFANIDASLVIWPPFHSLFELLDPSFLDGSIFIAASDVLQEIASKSPLSDGSGLKSLTEPLLGWFDVVGNRIMESTLATNEVSPISHSLCGEVAACSTSMWVGKLEHGRCHGWGKGFSLLSLISAHVHILWDRILILYKNFSRAWTG